MGVPKFYRWVSERYPCLSEVVKENQIPEFDNLYLDMNGIIHNCSHPNDEDPHFRISEAKIFEDIFHYIEFLFRIIRPQKVFFMAVDGVAPRAKMNQQRGRRFMSAVNAAIAAEEAQKKGETLPDAERFDSNCITPGTEFMAKLHEQLQYFVRMKISLDQSWRGVKVFLSGHDVPGEGEHKIMDYIRYTRSQPGYDPNTRHCLYGLDADLMMLGLSSHEPHFSLLREEVKFYRPKKDKAPKIVSPEETTFHLLHLSLFREYIDFEFAILKDKLQFVYNLDRLIDDWVLMGFLVGNDFIPHLPHLHIHESALPILYEAYKKIMPSLDGYLNEGGKLNLARFETFLQALAQFDRDHFGDFYEDQKYMESKSWKEIMADRMRDIRTITVPGTKRLKKSQSPKNKENKEPDLSLLSKEAPSELKNLINDQKCIFGLPSSDSDSEVEGFAVFPDDNPWAPLNAVGSKESADIKTEQEDATTVPSTSEQTEEPNAKVLVLDRLYDPNDLSASDEEWGPDMEKRFSDHKRVYYQDKLEYEKVTPEVLREQAVCYITAIQWNLHYYYDGCVSWSWYYPHHYSPYLSDVKGFSDLDLKFDLGDPFKPFQQLLAVLPSQSRKLLPKAYQDLMIDETSPILDYYPTTFKTDLNGKKQDWEAVVLIPFIDEKRLLNAMAPRDSNLTPDEQNRNSYGKTLVFSYKYQLKESKKSTKSENVSSKLPGVMPNLEEDLADCERFDRTAFHLPSQKILKGLLPNARLEVYIAGFPTFKHIPLKHQLKRVDVKVFQSTSKNDSMVLYVETRPEMDFKGKTGGANKHANIDSIVDRILGREVYVNWPYLIPAQACSLVTRETVFTKDGERRIRKKPSDVDHFERHENNIRSRYFNNRAVELVDLDAILYVRLLLGTRKIIDKNGNVITEKEWAEITTPYALSTVIESSTLKRPAKEKERIASNRNSKNEGENNYLMELFPVHSRVFVTSSFYYGCSGTVSSNQDSLQVHKLRIKLETSPEADMQFLHEKNKQQGPQEGSSKQKPAAKKQTLLVHARSLFRPELVTGNVVPDKSVKFQVHDRIVNVRDGISVPLGTRGTVTNIFHGNDNNNNGKQFNNYSSRQKVSQFDFKLDVLFDQEFFGGKAWQGEGRRGYRLAPSCVLNLTHQWRQMMQDRHQLKPVTSAGPSTSGADQQRVSQANMETDVAATAAKSTGAAAKQKDVKRDVGAERTRSFGTAQTVRLLQQAASGQKSSAVAHSSHTNAVQSAAKTFGQSIDFSTTSPRMQPDSNNMVPNTINNTMNNSNNTNRVVKEKFAQPLCYIAPSENNVLDALTKNPMAAFEKTNGTSHLHVTVENLIFGSYDPYSVEDRKRFNHDLKRHNLIKEPELTENQTGASPTKVKLDEIMNASSKAKKEDAARQKKSSPPLVEKEADKEKKFRDERLEMFFAKGLPRKQHQVASINNRGLNEKQRQNLDEHTQSLRNLLNIGNESNPNAINYAAQPQNNNMMGQTQMSDNAPPMPPYFGHSPSSNFSSNRQQTPLTPHGGFSQQYQNFYHQIPPPNYGHIGGSMNSAFSSLPNQAPPQFVMPQHGSGVNFPPPPVPMNIGFCSGDMQPPRPTPFDFDAMRRAVMQQQQKQQQASAAASAFFAPPPPDPQARMSRGPGVMADFSQPLLQGGHFMAGYDPSGLFVPLQVLKNQPAPAYIQNKMASAMAQQQQQSQNTMATGQNDVSATSDTLQRQNYDGATGGQYTRMGDTNSPGAASNRSKSRLAIKFGP